MSLVPMSDQAGSLATYADLAGRIAKTEFVPDGFKNRPEAILACLMYGQEIGLGPMQSLHTINVIKGKPSLSPEGMRALVLQAGHRIWPDEMTDDAVSLSGWRKGDPDSSVTTVRWTLDDAKRAGLTTNETWKKYPRAMLLARATSELCRALFPDVIAGLSYTPEEVESFSPPPPQPTPARSEVVGEGDPFPSVDPETGEVRSTRTRRKPPTAAPVLATVEQRKDVADALALVPEERKAELVQAWTEAGIESFKAAERFTPADAERALALIAEVMASPVGAGGEE